MNNKDLDKFVVEIDNLSSTDQVLGELEMGEPKDGRFSTNLLSLQLQLQTLMEEVGGEYALRLLDTLTELTKTEQRVMLNTFTKVAQRFSRGALRVESADDKQMKELEDAIFDDIMLAMKAASRTAGSGAKALPDRLQLLEGGAQPASYRRGAANASPISLEDARKSRKARSGRVLN